MTSKADLLSVIDIQQHIARAGLDFTTVMSVIISRAQHLLNADGAAIEIREQDDLIYRASCGIVEEHLGIRIPLRQSLSGKCIQCQHTLISSDCETDMRVNKKACREIGLRSMIVTPLIFENKVEGVIKVVSKQIDHFDERAENILTLLSSHIAATLHYSKRHIKDNLVYLATHDAMTKLTNRSFFIEKLHKYIALNREAELRTGLILMDLDGLKNINDTHGHRYGDALIIEFAKRLRRCIRSNDVASRLGGDEFGVLLPSVNIAVINEAVARIKASLVAPFEFEGETLQLSASIGTNITSKESTSAANFMHTADMRMYEVKQRNKPQTRKSA